MQDCHIGALLYAGTRSPALYRSDELGNTWHDLASLREVSGTETSVCPRPPHIEHVKNIAFHPDRPGDSYVCVAAKAERRAKKMPDRDYVTSV